VWEETRHRYPISAERYEKSDFVVSLKVDNLTEKKKNPLRSRSYQRRAKHRPPRRGKASLPTGGVGGKSELTRISKRIKTQPESWVKGKAQGKGTARGDGNDPRQSEKKTMGCANMGKKLPANCPERGRRWEKTKAPWEPLGAEKSRSWYLRRGGKLLLGSWGRTGENSIFKGSGEGNLKEKLPPKKIAAPVRRKSSRRREGGGCEHMTAQLEK